MKSDDILKRTQELLGAKSEEKAKEKAQLENERRLLVTSIGQEIAQAIAPALENLIKANEITVQNLQDALSSIQVELPPMPEVKIPPINVPRTVVNVPEVKIPTINVPEPKVVFPERMSVSMDSVDNKRPLPVMMMGTDGKPLPFSMGAGGGGKADYFTIKDIKTSLGASLINDEGNLKIAGSFSVTASNSSTQAIDSSGEVYTRANPFPVYDMSGSSGSVASALIDSSGIQYSGSNPVPVTLVSGGTSTTAVQNLNGDGTYRDTFPVQGTVTVSSITATTAVANIDSTGVQYSGSNPFPMRVVTDATATVNVVNVDSAGAYRGTFPVQGTVAVSSVSGTTAVNISDSSGVGYSGSNPVPVTMITSAIVSTIAVGPVASDVADDGSAPIKTGGIARQANPTAVASGDTVSSTYDDLGRQVMRVNQVRDLTATAYTSLTNGTEATLLSASAGFYFDLVYIMCANNSDASATVDVRGVTGGNVLMTLVVPPYGTSGVSLPVPLPQQNLSDSSGNNWTVDMNDITGTTVYVSALFTKEA